jgi:hypothetical protein
VRVEKQNKMQQCEEILRLGSASIEEECGSTHRTISMLWDETKRDEKHLVKTSPLTRLQHLPYLVSPSSHTHLSPVDDEDDGYGRQSLRAVRVSG